MAHLHLYAQMSQQACEADVSGWSNYDDGSNRSLWGSHVRRGHQNSSSLFLKFSPIRDFLCSALRIDIISSCDQKISVRSGKTEGKQTPQELSRFVNYSHRAECQSNMEQDTDGNYIRYNQQMPRRSGMPRLVIDIAPLCLPHHVDAECPSTQTPQIGFSYKYPQRGRCKNSKFGPNAEIQLMVSRVHRWTKLWPGLGLVRNLQGPREVVELCCFPLAIIQEGAYIAKSQDLAGYLGLYADNRAQLLSKKLVQSHDKYAWTVYTTWRLSFDSLGPVAQEFMMLCSHLHHEGISEDIFKSASVYVGLVYDPRHGAAK
ncbi:hypothetical protein GGX14DRAFT_404741 [Mycena pura]|uniref:Uncharacterized protein n=1 Tax=Mycena pura TaxID=153505 RepID=A0AAD6Y4X4_9AGAR|nr:hypothetical protein GGX14DRAFT_404741 [Mycena pura]